MLQCRKYDQIVLKKEIAHDIETAKVREETIHRENKDQPQNNKFLQKSSSYNEIHIISGPNNRVHICCCPMRLYIGFDK